MKCADLVCCLLFLLFCVGTRGRELPASEIDALCDLSDAWDCPQNCSEGCGACGASCDITTDSHIISIALNGVGLSALPAGLGQRLSALTALALNGNPALSALPDDFGLFPALSELHIEHCPGLSALPMSFGSLSSLKVLSFYKSGVSLLPDSFCSLSALSVISLEGNALSVLPEHFGSLAALTTLYLRLNALAELPQSFGSLASLKELFLDSNSLTALPENFGSLAALTSLQLAYNRLYSLPPSFSRLVKLSSLSLDQCCLNCSGIMSETWPAIVKTSCTNQREDCWGLPSSSSGAASPGGFGPGTIAVIVLLAVCGFAALVLFVLLVRRRNRPVLIMNGSKGTGSSSSAELEDLHLPLIAGGAPIVVEPDVLMFGSERKPIVVDASVHDSFILRSSRKKPVGFRIVLPVSRDRFEMQTSVASGVLQAHKEVEVDVSLKILCTTRIETEIAVVVAELGVIPIRVRVESQLSLKLDVKELEFGDPLGSGAFGTVYRGKWRDMTVAIKSYNDALLVDPALRSEIEQEVELCAQLRHPCIVTFFGAARIPSKFFLVMELCSHGALSSLLEQQPLEFRLRVRMAQDVASGMSYLHKNNIIHRDLKPDNVLVTSLDPAAAACCKLSDFNTSRFSGLDASMTKTKGIGTPSYMAPELLAGSDKYDSSVDVYSFGVLLWALWTQKEPFADFKNKFLIFRFVGDGKRLAIPENVPGALADLTTRAWADDPKARPTFADALPILSGFLSSPQEHQQSQAPEQMP